MPLSKEWLQILNAWSLWGETLCYHVVNFLCRPLHLLTCSWRGILFPKLQIGTYKSPGGAQSRPTMPRCHSHISCIHEKLQFLSLPTRKIRSAMSIRFSFYFLLSTCGWENGSLRSFLAPYVTSLSSTSWSSRHNIFETGAIFGLIG